MSLAVLALVTDAFGGKGGIAQYNRDFLSLLAEAGSGEITVLPRLAADAAKTPPRIVQKPPRPRPVSYALHAFALALTRKVDVVFCGHLYLVTLAWLVARLKGAKLVVQAHGIDAWSRPSRLRRRACESADMILCVSRYTRARVLDWAAVIPERVLVIANTVDARFRPGDGEAGDGEAAQEALGLRGKRILLTVGRMDSRERYKGQDRVIEALPKLLGDGHDVAYVIVGDGDDRLRLERLARDKGMTERVHFVGDMDQDELVAIYRAADLFVMPSSGEGFGISYLEAMASGTPALGLDRGGARDALADGELGMIAAEADLAEAIAGLLGRPLPNRQALAAAVRARFGRDNFAASIRHLVERLGTPPYIGQGAASWS